MEAIELQNINFVRFNKVNIFGNRGVGKSSLISFIENYNYKNIKFHENFEIELLEHENKLVERVINIFDPIKKDKDSLYLFYPTNLDDLKTINSNLDTLLFQTKCVLIMWDKSKPNTFKNIPKLIKNIKYIKNIDIFIIQNKKDCEFRKYEKDYPSERDINDQIESLKANYNNIYKVEASMLDKEILNNLLDDIHNSVNLENQKNKDGIKNASDLVKIQYPFESIYDNNNQKTFNICLAGESRTGKSSFLTRFLYEGFENIQIGKDFEHKLWVNMSNQTIIIKISEEKNPGLFEQYSGFLLFYDITNIYSYENLDDLIKIIRKKNIYAPIIIIGNKIDKIKYREISKEKTKSFASKQKCKYFEVSCSDGINIIEILKEIIFDAYEIYTAPEEEKEKIKVNSDEKKCSCCPWCL